jgi:four helix bundle protein
MRGVKRFEDLNIWQISVELRDEINRLTDTGPVAKDFAFRNQIRDSAASPPRNIAEGFGRFKPRSFANFLRIARGSLEEVRNHLLDARTRNYFSDDDTEKLLVLQKRAVAGTTRLIQYLESVKGEGPQPLNLRENPELRTRPQNRNLEPRNLGTWNLEPGNDMVQVRVYRSAARK